MIRLKELREERGWSMRDAARFLKKTYTTYVNHEKEYREPNSEDLLVYAKAYNVSVDYLIGRTDEKEPYTRQQILDSYKYRMVLDELSDLPDERMMEAVEAIRKLKEQQ